jgi:hypothetical protein
VRAATTAVTILPTAAAPESSGVVNNLNAGVSSNVETSCERLSSTNDSVVGAASAVAIVGTREDGSASQDAVTSSHVSDEVST